MVFSILPGSVQVCCKLMIMPWAGFMDMVGTHGPTNFTLRESKTPASLVEILNVQGWSTFPPSSQGPETQTVVALSTKKQFHEIIEISVSIYEYTLDYTNSM